MFTISFTWNNKDIRLVLEDATKALSASQAKPSNVLHSVKPQQIAGSFVFSFDITTGNQ